MMKPKPRKTSRKPRVSFSQALFDAMMVDVMLGKTVRDICSGTKRPNIDTFYSWLAKDSSLSEQYRRAREAATDTFEADILTMARETDPDNATANKVKFEMLRFEIERRESVSHAIMTALENKK